MNEVREIFKVSGGDPDIYIRIGNIDLKIPRWKIKNENHRHSANVVLSDLGQTIWINIGDKYHDNKLEVLKSEFEYSRTHKY